LLAARYRVEVGDKEGKPVIVLEDDSKSFTMNFIKLLIASHYNQNDVPTFTVYNVAGGVFYTGNTQSPNVGVPPQIFNMDLIEWSYYSNAVPAIWLGTSSCPNPALANGPCGSIVACCASVHFPFSPFSLSPSAPCYGITSCSPSLTEEGWTITITNRWANVSESPVPVASIALVFAIITTTSPTIEETLTYIFVPYAAIIDNLPSTVIVSPGWYIAVSYTIYFPV
jgi:hypothetical protein